MKNVCEINISHEETKKNVLRLLTSKEFLAIPIPLRTLRMRKACLFSRRLTIVSFFIFSHTCVHFIGNNNSL